MIALARREQVMGIPTRNGRSACNHTLPFVDVLVATATSSSIGCIRMWCRAHTFIVTLRKRETGRLGGIEMQSAQSAYGPSFSKAQDLFQTKVGASRLPFVLLKEQISYGTVVGCMPEAVGHAGFLEMRVFHGRFTCTFSCLTVRRCTAYFG